MEALGNMVVAHDSIIMEQVFQRYHVNKHWGKEPDVRLGEKIYLLTKNLALPKGRASKLLPKFVGPYKVLP